MKKDTKLNDLGLLILRGVVGLYMLLAGVGKVQGEISNGLGSFYNDPLGFQKFQPQWLPDLLAAPYGYALPWLEVLVGVLLIMGLFTRVVGLVGVGMVASFTVALAIKFDSITAQPNGPGGPFNANYIQIAAYLLFAIGGAGSWSIDTLLPKKRK